MVTFVLDDSHVFAGSRLFALSNLEASEGLLFLGISRSYSFYIDYVNFSDYGRHSCK